MKKSDSRDPSLPSWDTVLLVCKACQGRSRAPKGMKNKAVVQELRSRAKAMDRRPRTLLTSCLGLCPKGATAVAAAGGGRPTRIVAVHSFAALGEAVTTLVELLP